MVSRCMNVLSRTLAPCYDVCINDTAERWARSESLALAANQGVVVGASILDRERVVASVGQGACSGSKVGHT